MDIDIELSFEMFCNAVCGPACSVISFLRRIPFQEGLDFLLDLLGNFLRASLSLSVVEAGGTFLVEPIHPFVHHRSGHVVNLCNFWGRVAPTTQQSRLLSKMMWARTDTRPTSWRPVPLQLIALFVGRLADGSVRHSGGKSSAEDRRFAAVHR